MRDALDSCSYVHDRRAVPQSGPPWSDILLWNLGDGACSRRQQACYRVMDSRGSDIGNAQLRFRNPPTSLAITGTSTRHGSTMMRDRAPPKETAQQQPLRRAQVVDMVNRLSIVMFERWRERRYRGVRPPSRHGGERAAGMLSGAPREWDAFDRARIHQRDKSIVEGPKFRVLNQASI